MDAENLGENRFRVNVTNVRRLALWLHPNMDVDFTKPISIQLIQRQVDPETKKEVASTRTTFQRMVTPLLSAMLRYLGDRRDYGLIYHSVLEIAIP